MAGKRWITELTGGPPAAPSSLLGTKEENVVPGEVVFALEPEAASKVGVSVPNIPADVAGARQVKALGPKAVDKELDGLGVASIARVHAPGPPKVAAGIARASDLGLETTMRVRYEADESPDAVAKRLNALDEVAWAEPSRWRQASVVPDDPRFTAQWGLAKIGCPDAWEMTVGDPAVVVAVLDTGVDLNHPELAPLLVPGQDVVDFPPNSIPEPGWVFEGDFTGVDAIPQDEVGHGTHVAGTICCTSDDGVGVAGVAWDVRLMPVKVLARIKELATDEVSGSGSSPNIAAGIRWAVDHGAKVINMSLGGPEETIVEREAIAYAISKGAVVVAAMGNDDSDQEQFPAAFPDVIAVAATDSADQRAWFSNRGSWIDVAAPGVGIESTYWDDTYASLSGTSMATPHVAGVAALILSRNPALSAEEVRNILRSTAKPLTDDPAETVPNDRYGHGLVQAADAVGAAAPVAGPTGAAEAEPAAGGRRRMNASLEAVACTWSRPLCEPSAITVTCASRSVSCKSALIMCHKTVLSPCKSVWIICTSEPVLLCGVTEVPQGPRIVEWEKNDPHGYDPYKSKYE